MMKGAAKVQEAQDKLAEAAGEDKAEAAGEDKAQWLWLRMNICTDINFKT